MNGPPCRHDPVRHRPGEPWDAAAGGACRLCWHWHNTPAYRRRWSAPAAPKALPLPCAHRGAEAGRVACGTCRGRVELKTFACAALGTCTLERPAPGHACCRGCASYEPDTYRLVAPGGCADLPVRFEGRGPVRAWNHRVTVCMAHLAAPELLEAALPLWRAQTVRPYLVVVDTGSPPDVCRRLEALRAPDLEVHFVRGHGWIHSSQPVAVALDLAHALCRTEYLLHSHVDVFPRRRDLVAWMLGRAGPDTPVVGWRMSPRNGTDEWRQCVSHTCTMLHMPTVRRSGATWSFERYYAEAGIPAGRTVGWPDTESTFNLCLRKAGVPVKFLGDEQNYTRQLTDFWDHARSLPGLRAYGAGTALHRKVERYASEALADARARAREWGA